MRIFQISHVNETHILHTHKVMCIEKLQPLIVRQMYIEKGVKQQTKWKTAAIPDHSCTVNQPD